MAKPFPDIPALHGNNGPILMECDAFDLPVGALPDVSSVRSTATGRTRNTRRAMSIITGFSVTGWCMRFALKRAAFPTWQSIKAIVALPDETRVLTGHDYQPGKREPAWESTVGEQKRSNSHVVGKDEADFVHLREERDKTLPIPKLMLLALQVNIRGGQLPEPEGNGIRYLKFPLDALEQAASWD